jgi:hypothetical protein
MKISFDQPLLFPCHSFSLLFSPIHALPVPKSLLRQTVDSLKTNKYKTYLTNTLEYSTEYGTLAHISEHASARANLNYGDRDIDDNDNLTPISNSYHAGRAGAEDLKPELETEEKDGPENQVG